MKRKINHIDLPLKEAIIMFILTLLKTIGLYTVTDVSEVWLITLKTIPFLIVIYGIISLFNSKKRYIYSIFIHILISFIIFADLVYFKYYNFMPSIKALLLAKQATGVKGCIIYFLKPIYFIMFLDIVPLAIYLYKRRKYSALITPNRKLATKYITVLMIMFLALSVTVIDVEGAYVYGNYGIYTYHIYDIYESLSDESKEVYSEDMMDILEKEKNETKKEGRKYFGVAKGRNVIVIQFESLQNFVINNYYKGQEITPNLNKLIEKDSIYFSNYYQQVGPGNTSDAEFVSNNSMYPLSGYSVFTHFTDNTFYSFPKILKERGYVTKAFHGFKGEFWNRENMYPKQGIDEYISLEDFEKDDLIGLGLSDYSFFKQTLEHLKNTDKPFYASVVTLTSHHPYIIPKEKQNLELSKEHEGTLFGNYIQSINYSDMALGKFIEGLKETGLYENSIIVIYGDHFGLYPSHENNKEIMTEYLGFEYTYDEAFNIPLIIHIPALGKAEENTIVGGEIDFLPTMLNLLGIEDDNSIFFGKDLNNAESGFVALQYYLPLGSFIDDKKVFIMSSDGKFENSVAWDLKTRELIDIEKCREGYNRAINEKRKSDYIIKNDLLKNLLLED
ncbi:LTA synthase family protein [Caldisalinibacter kiritimatiensis]|uniref:Lipoteichoic acid synthase LtaS Type IIIa n=1 Tax=Caldisalinibacter kiritimatiensis TaxID=1304284 RepID=R1AV67_9FIRM|nr:LTA synthase family protein [Caldisalinibacter kiritimatiensis]EOD00527.1 Lipoteichoic acid synthase LtaS Type IIIa [Caldisalinibacter kiritimatiensis]